MNGYNFTQPVRKALGHAREEAARLHHEYVGTEHELLGLLREDEDTAATMLRNLGVSLADVRSRVESTIMHGNRSLHTGPDLPYTSRAKKVLELTMDEARALNHPYVGTEHLLIGLLREERGIAAQVLTSFGVTVDASRAELLRLVLTRSDANPPTEPPPSTATAKPRRYQSTVVYPLAAGRIEKIIAEARAVAVRAGSAELAGVHVAIALLANGEGTAIAALQRMGCDVPRVAAELEATLPGSAVSPPPQVVTDGPELRQVIDAAHRERQAWGARIVATHHLLIALLETCPDVAKPFNAQGVTTERLRVEARNVMG